MCFLHTNRVWTPCIWKCSLWSSPKKELLLAYHKARMFCCNLMMNDPRKWAPITHSGPFGHFYVQKINTCFVQKNKQLFCSKNKQLFCSKNKHRFCSKNNHWFYRVPFYPSFIFTFCVFVCDTKSMFIPKSIYNISIIHYVHVNLYNI